MTALPKRKLSTRRKGKRRAAIKLGKPNLGKCPHCNQPKIPHRICPNCNQY